MPYSFPTWDEFQQLSGRVLALELASPGGGIPPAPQNLRIVPQGTDHELHWDPVVGASYYRVYQQASSAPDPHWFAEIQATQIPLGTPNQTIYYVTTFNAVGESLPSDTVTH